MESIAPAWLVHLLLSIYNIYSHTQESIKFYYNKLYYAYNTLFNPRYYIFLKGSVYPHQVEINQVLKNTMAAPELFYNADERLFFPWSATQSIEEITSNPRSPIKILSLELLSDDGKLQYDLTDFIESMRSVIIPGGAVPTLGQIISVWQLWSRVLLDPSQTNARYIDTDGNVVETNVRSTDASVPADASAPKV